MSQYLSARALPNVFARAEKLPGLSSVAVEVMCLAQGDSISSAELSYAIARDPALAAKIIRLADSGLRTDGRASSGLLGAVLRLGAEAAAQMALAFSLADELPRKGPGRFDYNRYWTRSVTTAVAGRRLAHEAIPDCQDEAFLCGLLCEAGQLVMLTIMPEEYELVLAAAADRWPTRATELELLSFHRGHLVEVVFENWCLPRKLRVGARYIHDRRELPPDSTAEEVRFAGVLHMSALATEVACGSSEDNVRERLLNQAQEFGLDEETLNRCLLSIEKEIVGTAELFDVSMSTPQPPQGFSGVGQERKARSDHASRPRPPSMG